MEILNQSYDNVQLFISENGGCSSSYQSFLYSLYNIKEYQPIGLSLTGNKAILGRAKFGPAFGCSWAYDLHISNNASSNFDSHSDLGYDYQTLPRCKISCGQFFVGNWKFKPSDVEVFYETTA